jgi:hypothetical protein
LQQINTELTEASASASIRSMAARTRAVELYLVHPAGAGRRFDFYRMDARGEFYLFSVLQDDLTREAIR